MNNNLDNSFHLLEVDSEAELKERINRNNGILVGNEIENTISLRWPHLGMI